MSATALREGFRMLRARLAARPDTEHEQALVRLVIITIFLVYLLAMASADAAVYEAKARGRNLAVAAGGRPETVAARQRDLMRQMRDSRA